MIDTFVQYKRSVRKLRDSKMVKLYKQAGYIPFVFTKLLVGK